MKAYLSVTLIALLFVYLFFLPALAGDKETADLLFKVGIKALQEGETAKAKECFQKALKSYPTHTGAVTELGKLFAKERNSTELVNLYNDWLKALKRTKPTPEQLKTSKRLTSDLALFNKLNMIDKRYSSKFVSLARALKRKDEPAAIKACETAIELDPNNTAAVKEHQKLTGTGRSSKKTSTRSRRSKKNRIFNGTSLSGWASKMGVRVNDGCLTLSQYRDALIYTICTKVTTKESFTLEFSFQTDKAGADPLHSLYIQLWSDKHAWGSSRLYLRIREAEQTLKLLRLEPVPWEWYSLTSTYSFKSPSFKPGKWYKMSVEYDHQKGSASKITVSVDGEKAGTIPVSESIYPKRSGYIGLSQWRYKSVKFKDIYLMP